MPRFIALAVVSLALIPAQAGAQAFYPIWSPCPDCYFGVWSESWDISADGSTVVGDAAAAFVWNAETGHTVVPVLHPDYPESFSLGVSGDGSTVVGYSSGEAFIWTGTGGTGALSDYSQAFAVSDDGTKVLLWPGPTYFDTTTGELHAVSGFSMETYFTPISPDGQFVLGSSAGQAARWSVAGGAELLGVNNGLALGSSYDASVIVGEGDGAWRWVEGVGVEYLGTPDPSFPARSCKAVDVSHDGAVVLGHCRYRDSIVFVWDAVNGIRTLQTVLDDLGFELTGWLLTEARAISGDGQAITGYGHSPLGTGQRTKTSWVAYLSPLPETCTARLCEDAFDNDGDGLTDSDDPECVDVDGNGVADFCEPVSCDVVSDVDGDGVPDELDEAPYESVAGLCPCEMCPTELPDVADAVVDTRTADHVTCEEERPWRNHGEFVRCVTQVSNALSESLPLDVGRIQSDAAGSSCGR